jgi:hypothetical protein
MTHVYVLGAGASAASAGAPLGKDLVWSYFDEYRPLTLHRNGIPDLTEENKSFAGFRKFLELYSLLYPELRNILKEWDERGSEVFWLQHEIHKNYYVDELLELLHQNNKLDEIALVRNLIFEHLALCCFYANAEFGNKLYKRFILEILKKASCCKISIISFNFDFLLHEDFRNNIYFDYLINFDWIDDNRKKIYAVKNPFNLIKLNGSLDWGICPLCNMLFLYFPNMSDKFYTDKKCPQGCNINIQPFIVIPHEKYNSIIDKLWLSAINELQKADMLTIIGYSFPAYDKKVINLFSDNLKPDVKIQIVDHCGSKENQCDKKNDLLLKYREMFPMLKNEPEIILTGFEGYLNSRSR